MLAMLIEWLHTLHTTSLDTIVAIEHITSVMTAMHIVPEQGPGLILGNSHFRDHCT